MSSMLPRKRIMVLVIGLLLLGWFVPRQQKIAATRRAIAEAQLQEAEIAQNLLAATAVRDNAWQELEALKKNRDASLDAVARVERELARIAPDSVWATPPTSQPEWNDRSPYIWVRKAMVPQLPVKAFGDNGELDGGVGVVLALDGVSLKALNAKLTKLMSQYHTLEVAQAERVDKPLPGIVKDGPHVTVRVKPLPEEGARFKQQFADTLRADLGKQRAELLMQSAEGWFDKQFSQSGAEPKTVSVVRHPNGTYNVSIRSGNSWFSTGGFRNLGDYVPAHLFPLFSDVLEEGAGTGIQVAE